MSNKRVKLDEQTERDFEVLAIGLSWAPGISKAVEYDKALARIRAKLEEAIAASQGGHAQNCGCHNTRDECGAVLHECYGNPHPYHDPRCSPSPLPQSAREKVREALKFIYERQLVEDGKLVELADSIEPAMSLLESALEEKP